MNIVVAVLLDEFITTVGREKSEAKVLFLSPSLSFYTSLSLSLSVRVCVGVCVTDSMFIHSSRPTHAPTSIQYANA